MIPFRFEKACTEQDAIGAPPRVGDISPANYADRSDARGSGTSERLIDINALSMGGVRVEGSDLLIGALARMAEVAAHPDTQRLQPLIAETLIEGASPQLRNMASIGGNLMQRVRCPYFGCSTRPATSGTRARAARRSKASTAGTRSWEQATNASPRTLPISPSRWSRWAPR